MSGESTLATLPAAAGSPAGSPAISPYGNARVRTALAHFLVGRAATALLAFATLLLLVRVLPVAEYGAFVGLMAARGVLGLLASLGLDGMSARFLPELRIRGEEAALARVTAGILATWSLVLAAMGVGFWLAPAALLAPLHLESWAAVAPLFAALVVVGGVANFAGGLLEALLLQRASQAAAFAASLTRLAFLAVALFQGHLTLADALWAELLGNGVALVIALGVLVRQLRPGRGRLPGGLRARMGRFALLNYLGQMLRQTQGPHGLRLAVVSALGVAASAQFGFVMSLADTLQRYLPTTLFAGLLRPVLVSRYLEPGGSDRLGRYAAILFKLNLLLVLPAVALTLVQGETLAVLLGGEKYREARWLLPAAFLLLTVVSHSLIISLVANTIERNGLQLWGGGLAAAGLVLGFVLAESFGPYGVLLGTLLGAIAYNGFAVHYLRRQGQPYGVDWPAVARLVLAAAGGVALPGFAAQALPGAAGLAAAMVLGGCLYLVSLRLARPFDAAERALMSRLLPGRLARLSDLLLGPVVAGVRP